MSQAPKFRHSIFSNTWVVTLSATLLGVFIALYLNELVASNKLQNQKTISSKNILLEISNNESKLKTALQKHIELYETIGFMEKYLTGDEKIVAPTDSMTAFRLKYPHIIHLEDSLIIENDIYQYQLEVKLDFTLPQLEISTIAWETLVNSSISSAYSFECLMNLGTVYRVFSEISNNNKELLNYFWGKKEPGEKSRDLLRDLGLLIKYEKSTLELIEGNDQLFGNCG